MVREADSWFLMPLPKTLVLIISAVMAVFSQEAVAGGVFHVFPPMVEARPVPVARPTMLVSRALVTVSEYAIEYRIDQTFYNDNEFPVNGLFILPLERYSSAHPPDVRVDGIVRQGEILTPSEFFPILRKLTEQMQDPSLLGLAGRRVLVVRDVNLGIRKQKTFRIVYRSPALIKDDLVEINVPMDGERYAVAPVMESEISVRFKMSRHLKSLFSPSHSLIVMREAPHRGFVTAKRTEKRMWNDFKILAIFGAPSVDLKVLTHRPLGEDGYFMAVVGAPSSPGRTQEPDKDVVVVADVSGSLDSHWRETMKRCLSFCLGKLGSGDRFNVLAMGTRVSRMSDGLISVSDKNVLKGIEFLDSVDAAGGTDLYNAMMQAVEQFTTRKRQRIVVLISDGRSTVGVTDPERLIDDVTKHNRFKARVFVLAVGDRTNLALMDRLTVATKGRMMRLSAADGFQSTLSRFVSSISPPQVSRLALNFGNASTRFVYPDPLTDLYRRESLFIVGRYSGKEDATVKTSLTWKMEGHRHQLSRMVRLPLVEPRHPYLASLWAMRRFGSLLERDLMKGPDHLVRQKIRSLAAHYGFRIPPFLEHKPSQTRHRPPDVDLSSILWHCKTGCSPRPLLAKEHRFAGGRIFRKELRRWVDTRFRSSLNTKSVEAFSNDYFSLLKNNPEIGPCLALGPDVTLVLGDRAVAVFTK